MTTQSNLDTSPFLPRVVRRFATVTLGASLALASLVALPAGAFTLAKWTPAAIPWSLGADTIPALAAVSCTAPTTCSAVGNYVDGAGNSHPLIEMLSAKGWTTVTPATPVGGVSAQLSTVNCRTGVPCVAAGSFTTSSGTSLALIETVTTKGWVASFPPSPAGALSVQLSHVSCLSASSCIAVGSYENAAKVWQPLIARSSGATWSTVTPAGPPLSASAQLNGVSCGSATACYAVGVFQNTKGAYYSFAEALVKGKWKASTTPSPAGSTSVQLSVVSCPAANACNAVGTYEDAKGNWHSIVVTLKGTSWNAVAISNPTSSTSAQLSDISCPSTAICFAVGTYLSSSGSWHSLIETLSGSTWVAKALADPTGIATSQLVGVSCSRPAACVAAGSATSTTGAYLPLAVTYS